MINDELLTVQELSDYLKVRKETTLKIINNKEIVATKVGRDWRIFKSDVMKYLKKNSSNKLESLYSKCIDNFNEILRNINTDWSFADNATRKVMIAFRTRSKGLKKYQKYCLHIFDAIMDDFESCMILSKNKNINGQLKILRSILESTIDLINFNTYGKDYLKFLKAYYFHHQDILEKKIDNDTDESKYKKVLRDLFKSDIYKDDIDTDNFDDFNQYSVQKCLTIRTKINLINISNKNNIPYFSEISYDILFSWLSMHCHNNVFFLLEDEFDDIEKFTEETICKTVMQAFSCLCNILSPILSMDISDFPFKSFLSQDVEDILGQQDVPNYDVFDE